MNAPTLAEWAEGWADETWTRVVERENANASAAVIWYHRGRNAAYAHLVSLLAKYPELNAAIPDHATTNEREALHA